MNTRRLFWICLSCLAAAGCATVTQTQMRQADQSLVLAWENAEKGNWAPVPELVDSALTHVREGIAHRPERATPSGPLDLRPLLETFEKGPGAGLLSAARKHDRAGFSGALNVATAQCLSCHARIGKPDLPVRHPWQPVLPPAGM